MTGMRSEQDIERILRSTLTEVAATVTEGVHVTAPTALRAPRGQRSRRWVAPLVAVAAVAAIAAALALLPAHKGHRNAPVGPPTVSTSPSPSPTAHALQTVRLAWWTTPIPSGYTEVERIVTAQFSGEQLIKNNDPQRNTIGNGGGPAGTLVREWAPGAFNAATVAAPTRVRIGTHPALFGAAPAGMFDDQIPYATGSLPTLAVQVATDRWVTFASETTLTQRKDELIRVATAVLSTPATTTSMTVPFQFKQLAPTLHILGATEDLDPTHPYGLIINITDGPLAGPIETVQQTTDLDIQIWQQDTVPTSPTGGSVVADGRIGVLETTGQAAYFPIGGRLADVEINGPNTSEETLRSVLASLVWSPDPTNERTWYPATHLIR